MQDRQTLTDTMRTWAGESQSEITLRVSMVVAALSLLFAMFAMWNANQAQGHLRSVESRLACLELPGSNPCPVGPRG